MGLVDPVRARLESQVPELRGRTAGAIDLARLMAQNAFPQVTPFAHVIPGEVAAGPDEGITGAHVQPLTRELVVMLTVRSGDATGARALEAIEDLLDALVAALAGWAPEPGGDSVALRRVRLARAEAGAFVYELAFTIADQLRIAT